MKRVLRASMALAACCIGISIGFGAPMPVAHADSPTLFGWWTSANVSAVPATAPTDVPPGGFEVTQAGSVQAYAAIGHVTEAGEVRAILLDVAPGTASVPDTALVVCPLTSQAPFSPAQGRPLSEAPAYDCAKSAIPGVANANGTRISFAVSGLSRSGYLGVAIVVSGSGRQVFNRPADDSIQLTTDPAPAPTAEPAPPVNPPALISEPPQLGVADSPGIGSPVTVEPPPAAEPAPQVAVPSTSPAIVDAELVAITESPPTIGVGRTVIGAAIVLLLVLGTWSKNREIAQGARSGAGHMPPAPDPVS